jgi:hypothetical protein
MSRCATKDEAKRGERHPAKDGGVGRRLEAVPAQEVHCAIRAGRRDEAGNAGPEERRRGTLGSLVQGF